LIAEALRRRGVYPWLDRSVIPAGEEWERELELRLPKTRSVALVIGHGSSQQLDLEVELALARATRQGLPIITILLPGASLDSVPLALRSLQTVTLASPSDATGLDYLVEVATQAPPKSQSKPRVRRGAALLEERKRIPCVLVLDTSASMTGARIDALNHGLRTLEREIRHDEFARSSVEFSVVTFGDDVELAKDFGTLADDQLPILRGGGSTPTGRALQFALDLLLERLDHYRLRNIEFDRPWILLLTDGVPTDGWQAAAIRLRAAQSARQLHFIAIGIGPDLDQDFLRRLSPSAPVIFNGPTSAEMFDNLFRWLSQSIGTTFSRTDDVIVPPKAPLTSST
jgi:uncharacterized protein YegL